jgi:arylsulfatase A-like enzyme/Flp pilus assembly protein TadD
VLRSSAFARASADKSFFIVLCAPLLAGTVACGRAEEQPAPADAPRRAENLLLITIDTLRADAVGAYGSSTARTPSLDALAGRGLRFDRAFAPTPITLPSHASLLTGLYPPGHGARHNGVAMRDDVATLASVCEKAGFATAAFVSAFPLDRRFGLSRGFASYGDHLPRGAGMRPLNERPGSATMDEAMAWLVAGGFSRVSETSPKARTTRFFLWVHLFEPHAPYGNPTDGRPARERYADEVAEADRQVGRLLDGLGPARESTLVVAAGDHGEAFGEHGEIGHSIFVYDTTLRVPLIIAGPGIAPRVISEPASLVDVAPTVAARLGLPRIDADGIDLIPLSANASASRGRTIYAESFAPLLDFGWSSLRSVRRGGWKYIAAPRPELYEIESDAGELSDQRADQPARVKELDALVARISGPDLPPEQQPSMDPEAERRLRALGYAGGTGVQTGRASSRPDPKDRRELAARLARVTSGELTGQPLRRELEAILAEDRTNPQAHMRLAFSLVESNECPAAEKHFSRAIALSIRSADPYLGLAGCQARRGDRAAAVKTLQASERIERDNPVVLANLGILLSELGAHDRATAALGRAVTIDPDFHEARFNLAIAYATAGRRADAAREAQTLLERLPPSAPQRSEVQRLLDTVK